jgi:hypothetical protein
MYYIQSEPTLFLETPPYSVGSDCNSLRLYSLSYGLSPRCNNSLSPRFSYSLSPQDVQSEPVQHTYLLWTLHILVPAPVWYLLTIIMVLTPSRAIPKYFIKNVEPMQPQCLSLISVTLIVLRTILFTLHNPDLAKPLLACQVKIMIPEHYTSRVNRI